MEELKLEYAVLLNFQFIKNDNQWTNLQTIIKIESTREFKNSDRKTEKAIRYYISSLKNSAKEFQSKVRSHWTIKNKLYWTLDVTFSKDASRKRTSNASQNYSTLPKVALNILKNDNTKRLKAA